MYLLYRMYLQLFIKPVKHSFRSFEQITQISRIKRSYHIRRNKFIRSVTGSSDGFYVSKLRITEYIKGAFRLCIIIRLSFITIFGEAGLKINVSGSTIWFPAVPPLHRRGPYLSERLRLLPMEEVLLSFLPQYYRQQVFPEVLPHCSFPPQAARLKQRIE